MGIILSDENFGESETAIKAMTMTISRITIIQFNSCLDVEETARLTDAFALMTEDQSAVLDEAFQRMLNSDRPEVRITYFRPDSRKDGGSYEEFRGTFRFFDVGNSILKFTDGTEINAEMVCGIEFEK